MSNLGCKYRMRLVFSLVSLWKIVMTVDAAADSGEKKLLCEKFANINPSQSFSFDELLHLQGFTNLRDDEVTMVADGYSYPVQFTETFDPAHFALNRESYYEPWLKDQKENYISSADEFEGNPDDRLDMAYYLYVYKDWIRSHYYVMAITDKRIICIRADFVLFAPSWVDFAKDFKIKLLTYKKGDDYTKMHVISEVPTRSEAGIKDKGLIIYDFKVDGGTFFNYECQPRFIYNINDLQTEPYFYLQRTINPNDVQLVHPKTGNVTQARLYPLAERVMPGYRYDKSFLLFDVDLGCVYILNGSFVEQFDLDALFKKQKDILLPRKNVPFEKFFICPGVSLEEKFSFLPPNRCDTTIHSDIKSMFGRAVDGDVNAEKGTNEPAFDSNFTSKTDFGVSTVGSKLTWFIVSMFVAVICLIAIGCYRIQKRKKSSSKNKDNKSNNSKSKNKKEPQAKSVISNGLKKKKSSVVANASVGQSSGGKDSANSKSKSAKSNTTTTTTTTSTTTASRTGLSK